ncbi:CotH kinase family protein [Cystobacter ferrugineus]|uniref:Lectin n=1 Tax=Cystobacter ferrugineus TaxID=83449 RepID=A0A1L9AZU6_9BACT|nr:CotH kinase family protein [Cystobacter ferrugineus]OJH35531.1 lectin [Cystobacter ferrugineus]
MISPRSSLLLPLLLLCSVFSSACGGDRSEEEPLPDVSDAGVGPHVDAGDSGDAGGLGDAGIPDAGSVVRPSEALFAGTSIPLFELTLSQASIDALNAAPDTYVKGDLRLELDGQILELPQIGVRLKGQLGSARNLNQKAAFLLKFDKFQNKQTLFGLKKLALNNMVQDPSMIHERLGYTLFREMDVPAPRSAYAVVYLNGSMYGLYSTVEATDNSDFLEHWFGSDDGNLYEGQYGSDLNVGQEQTFDQDKGEDVGFADLTQLAQALDQMTNPATFLEDVSRVIDIDTYVRFAATELFLGHWDGYASYKNNFYLYRRPSDQRWVFIPWGIDQIFVQYTDPWLANGRVQQKCVASTPCKVKLARAYTQVLESALRLDLQNQALDLGSLIWPAVYADPRKEVSVGTVYTKMSETLDFLNKRPADIQSRVGCVDPAACPRCTVRPAPKGGSLAFCTQALSVPDAEADCVAQGGHLVSIHDQATQDAVFTGARALSTGQWWLGLTDRTVEGDFTWSDGSPRNYTAWASGEPNDYGGNEDCTQMLGTNGAWNDSSCSDKHNFVCALP